MNSSDFSPLMQPRAYDATGSPSTAEPRTNSADLTCGPCLRLTTTGYNYQRRAKAIEFLLSLEPPQPIHDGMWGDSARDLVVDMPLDRIGLRTTPRFARFFRLRYRANFRVLAQNEPFPLGFNPDEDLIIRISERHYQRFVDRYNDVARYYGLEELDAEMSVSLNSPPRFRYRFSFFGWTVELSR